MTCVLVESPCDTTSPPNPTRIETASSGGICTPAQYNVPFLLNHLKYLLPMHWLAVALSPGWCQLLARAIRPYTSYPGVLGGLPSPEGGQEAGGSSPERPRGTGRLLGPAGQAARLCLQWPVAVAAEDGHAAGAGWPEAGREPLLLRLRLWLNLLTLLLLASFCTLPGVQRPSHSRRELPLVTQL